MDADNHGVELIPTRSPTEVLVNQFEILNVLGTGGASVVYRARERSGARRECALKIFTTADELDGKSHDRFRQEFHAAHLIRHPNLIAAYELFEGPDLLAYTMECVEGTDLSRELREAMAVEEVVRIGRGVLAGLHALHKEGVLHRDVKPENVLLTAAGSVKLSDFGMLKTDLGAVKTKTGILLGTPQYMAPEYVIRGEYAVASDIFSVGIVLMECAAGKRYLAHESPDAILETLIRQQFSPDPSFFAALPRNLTRVLLRAVAYEPEERYESAEEFAAELVQVARKGEGASSQSSANKGNATTSQPTLWRWALGVCGIVVIVLIALSSIR